MADNRLLNYIQEMVPSLPESQAREIADALPAVSYGKGHMLVRQGQIAPDCYFILQGCLRVFFVDDEGREVTSDFITENQSLTIFESYKHGKPSPWSVECLEDTLLLEGDLQNEQEMNRRFPALQGITRSAMEENMAEGQEMLTSFKASSPEQRYLQLLDKRPGLAARVAQHQLASYLGITPESFSRLKKRLLERKLAPGLHVKDGENQ